MSAEASGIVILIVLLLMVVALAGRGRSISAISRRDWIVYLGISVAIVAGIIASAIDASDNSSPVHVNNRWFVTFVMAVLVFGNQVQQSWRFRKRPKFWLVIGILVVAHFTVFLSIFHASDEVPLGTILFGIPEMMVVFLLTWAVGFRANVPTEGREPEPPA